MVRQDSFWEGRWAQPWDTSFRKRTSRRLATQGAQAPGAEVAVQAPSGGETEQQPLSPLMAAALAEAPVAEEPVAEEPVAEAPWPKRWLQRFRSRTSL